MDSEGHRDICQNCMGLGTTTQNQAEGSEIDSKTAQRNRKPLIRALWILAVVMAVYYSAFIFGDMIFHFSLSIFILILIAGHSISVGGFILYLILVSIPKELKE
ncbi:MAG: hypothetical protein QW597_07255 [Thermoplasmataceae archaeon]